MVTGEVAAVIPVPDVRRDMAGLGGAGRVLLSDEAESTEAAEEAENVDMVESRLEFFLKEEDCGENWKDGLDGVGGFDGIVVFGLKIEDGGKEAAAAAKEFNGVTSSSVGRSLGNSIIGASKLLCRWRLSGVGVVGEMMAASVTTVEVSRVDFVALEFCLSLRLSFIAANSVGAMVGGGRKVDDGEGKPGITAGELGPIESVSDWLDSGSFPIKMW